MEYLNLASLVGGLIALVTGMVTLGWGGATPRRRRGKRVSLLTLGAISTVAAVVLLHRIGGFEVLAMIGSVLTVLIGAGVVIWYFVGLITSVDEALTPRESPPTDFQFLHQQQNNPTGTRSKRRSMAERMGLMTAGERIAKMRWMFRKPPQS